MMPFVYVVYEFDPYLYMWISTFQINYYKLLKIIHNLSVRLLIKMSFCIHWFGFRRRCPLSISGFVARAGKQKKR